MKEPQAEAIDTAVLLIQQDTARSDWPGAADLHTCHLNVQVGQNLSLPDIAVGWFATSLSKSKRAISLKSF